MANPILEMRAITKTFPGVKALQDVSMSVERGEIHAICGENGAGKSTLMKVLSGVYPHGTYDGSILFEGEEVQFGSINDSEAKGIVIIHQELALVPYLSVAENIFLGNERSHRGLIDWNVANSEAAALLARVGLDELPGHARSGSWASASSSSSRSPRRCPRRSSCSSSTSRRPP